MGLLSEHRRGIVAWMTLEEKMVANDGTALGDLVGRTVRSHSSFPLVRLIGVGGL